MADNKYNILAISEGIAGNHNDAFQVVDLVEKMLQSMDRSGIDYGRSHLNADAGFDVKRFKNFLEKHLFIPNIKQNKRNTKKKEQQYQYMADYIYQNRFKIEVVFSWMDTYKRLLVRFEVSAENFRAWLCCAAAMINFRHIFN